MRKVSGLKISCMGGGVVLTYTYKDQTIVFLVFILINNDRGMCYVLSSRSLSDNVIFECDSFFLLYLCVMSVTKSRCNDKTTRS